MARKPNRRKCTVLGCDKPRRARGLCHGHLQRTLAPSNAGDPGEPELERQWRKWAPEEDRALLDLIDHGRGRCEPGEVMAIALHLERTVGAVHTRLWTLRKRAVSNATRPA